MSVGNLDRRGLINSLSSTKEEVDDVSTLELVQLEEILLRHLNERSADSTQHSLDSMISDSADLAWRLRQLEVAGALPGDPLSTGVPFDQKLKAVIGDLHNRLSDRQPVHLRLILLEYLQFESKYQQVGQVIDEIASLDGLSDSEKRSDYFRVYKVLSKLFSGDPDKRAVAFKDLVELTSSEERVRNFSTKVHHRVLKAAWHATEFPDLVDAPHLLERQAKVMIGLDLADSNVYFRMSRALLKEGRLAEARDAISKAIRLSTSPELTSQYLVESSLIISIETAVETERIMMEERSERMASDLRSKLHLSIQDASERMSHRIDSAIVFNLQIISIVIGAIAIGGTAWGVGSRLVDIYREESNELSLIKVIALWGSLTATTTLFVGVLLWVVWRMMGTSNKSQVLLDRDNREIHD